MTTTMTTTMPMTMPMIMPMSIPMSMPMSMPSFNGMPMPHGMIVMSIQMETDPIDNLMSSLMSPLISNLFNPRQISSSKNFLNIGYE
jgi:hypothetical protein